MHLVFLTKFQPVPKRQNVKNDKEITGAEYYCLACTAAFKFFDSRFCKIAQNQFSTNCSSFL